MGRTIELSGSRLSLALYACQLLAILFGLLFVAPRLGGSAGVVFGVLFAVLVLATAVGLWRSRTDGEGSRRPGTAGDITYDPFADPGQAAKDRWERAVRRLPGGDDED